MTYSDIHKYIFLAVPKTGSRTVQEHLKHHGTRSKKGWDPNHDTYEQVKEKLGEDKCKEYYTFAFFRNPWSLLISTFFYNKHKFHLTEDQKTITQWLNSYGGSDPFVPYLFDKDGNQILDFVGKLEHIDRDMKFVCDKLGIPHPEPTTHIGKQDNPKRIHYTEYYTPQLVEKFRNIFGRSLSVLKYEFDDAKR